MPRMLEALGAILRSSTMKLVWYSCELSINFIIIRIIKNQFPSCSYDIDPLFSQQSVLSSNFCISQSASFIFFEFLSYCSLRLLTFCQGNLA